MGKNRSGAHQPPARGRRAKQRPAGVRGHRLAMASAVALLTFLAFLPALHAGFLNWDDDANLTDNPHYRGLSAEHLQWMATAFHAGHYMPLTWLTFALDHAAWGMVPRGYHLTNLLLQAVDAALAFWLFSSLLRRAMGSDRQRLLLWVAAAGALAWAVHPLRVESVAWVTERRDVLSGAFFMITLLAYLRMTEAQPGRRGRWLLASVAAFALSLLSKAWGITLPVVLVILDLYPLRRLPGGGRRVWLEKVPFALLAAAAGVAALRAQAAAGALSSVESLDPVQRVVLAGYGLVFYLVKTVAPMDLSPLYILRRSFDPLTLRFLLPTFLAVGVTVLLVIRRRRWPAVLAAWAGYVVIVSPVLGLTQAGAQLAADRYTYLASLPIVVLLAGRLYRLLEEETGPLVRRVTTAGVVALLLVLGVLAHRQTRYWESSEVLWSRAVAVDSDNYLAFNNRGAARLDAGDLSGALADFTRALEIHPRYEEAYNNRGNVRLKTGHPRAAIEDYERAIDLDSTYAEAYLNRGNARQRTGDLDGAMDDYQQALALGASPARVYYNRGLARKRAGDVKGAIADYTRAVELDPGKASAWINRGNARLEQGEVEGAVEDLSRAIALEPGHANAYNSRGEARSRLGDLEGAVSDFSRAVELEPGFAPAWANRALARANSGDLRGGVADLRQALAVAPDGWGGKPAVEQMLQRMQAALAARDR
jgi:tetratricopeptide (TPR) repeat protein